MPKFVRQVITVIEGRGLTVDGIYRVSGNLAQIQRVRFMVETSKLSYNFLTPTQTKYNMGINN